MGFFCNVWLSGIYSVSRIFKEPWHCCKRNRLSMQVARTSVHIHMLSRVMCYRKGVYVLRNFQSEIIIFPTGFDLGGQVAIGISHWKSPFPPRGHPLCDSPDGVRSEASAAAAPQLPEHQEPVSCPASLSINPISSLCSASQETISDSSTSKVSPFNFEPWLHSNLSSMVWSLKIRSRNGLSCPSSEPLPLTIIHNPNRCRWQ